MSSQVPRASQLRRSPDTMDNAKLEQSHFHLVMGVAAMFGIFAGTYFWFPKMTGRMMNETMGKLHFWLSFVGAYCIFMPFHYLGMAGNVRRYSTFVDDFLQP